MPNPTLDFETYSESGFCWNPPGVDPKKPLGFWSALPGASQGKKGLPIVGASVYTEHASAEVLSAHYDLCDGRGERRWIPGMPPPVDLFSHVAAGLPLDAHNSMFEYLTWTNICCRKYGWPPLNPYVLRCTMATARVNNLPGKLENLGDVLALDVKKDKNGKRLLDKFSKPRNPTKTDPRLRILPSEDPEGPDLYAYGDRDVVAEQSASDCMEPMSDAELFFWQIDQEINRRGLGVDRGAIRDCLVVLAEAQEQYGREHAAITGGLQPGQLAEVRGWLAAHGVHLPDMQAETIDDALEREDLPAHCRRVLEIRELLGSASVKKLHAMENQANAANRILNLIVHHGARTGRPTGEGPQPLNLPTAGPKLVKCGACSKPHRSNVDACPWCSIPAPPIERKAKWSHEYVDAVLEIMATRSLALVEWFFGDALLAIQGCVRGLFVAEEGHDLLASDYSAIEAVVAAMISGEQWRIDTFRARKDIYLSSASKITGTPLETYLQYAETHGENHPDRQLVGKIAELACLSPATQVLTNRGLVRMGDVRTSDLLWDGVEWVAHAGLVERGRKATIRVDGVAMTPDHLALVGSLWVEAGQLVSNKSTLCRALATGSGRLPSFPPNGDLGTAESQSLASVGGPRTSSRGRIYARERAPLARRAGGKKPGPSASRFGVTRISSPTSSTVDGCSIEYRLVSRDADRTGTPITGVEESGFFQSGRAAREAGGRFLRTSSPCPDGSFRRLNSIELTPTAITPREICGSRPNRKARNVRFATCKRLSTITRRVCDLANAGPRNRFTIKTDSGWLIVHNCGYGGWEGAWRAFDPAEADKSSDEICAIIRAWRDASPQIVAHWGGQRVRNPHGYGWLDELYGIEGAVIAAIQNPGFVYVPRPPSVGGIKPWPVDLQFYVRDDILRMVLPSGREIKYWNPRVAPSSKRPGTLEISYMTWNTNPKYGALGWVRMATWGSRMYENADQAIAHDILRGAIIRLRAAGYTVVLHVYDEIVAEVRKGLGSVEEFERLMVPVEAYCADWPIRAAGGWRGRRYRKG